MKKLVYCILALSLLYSCIPTKQSQFISYADIQQLPVSYDLASNKNQKACYDWEYYVPDTNHLDHTPMRFIRLNMHWFNTSDSIYTPGEFRAKEYTVGAIRAANYDLRKNQQMYLPHGNNLPALPIQIRYLLTTDPERPRDRGIYFHYDDDEVHYVHTGKNRNLGRRNGFNKYAVQKDSVLNIFVHAHDPDSIISPTYGNYLEGCALGNFIKMVGIYCNYEKRSDYWNSRAVINHEVGHIYGLGHTWAYNDGCDDTPLHDQKCFSRTQSPECDTMTSNNIMDNGALQNAWTPCQIGKVHARMAKLGSRQRKFLYPSWCELKDSMHIYIQDTIHWRGAKDVEGHLTIESGGHLTIGCRLSMPPGGLITIKEGGTLVLDDAHVHSDCNGALWEGIAIEGKDDNKGEVIFIGNPKLENMRNQIE